MNILSNPPVVSIPGGCFRDEVPHEVDCAVSQGCSRGDVKPGDDCVCCVKQCRRCGFGCCGWCFSVVAPPPLGGRVFENGHAYDGAGPALWGGAGGWLDGDARGWWGDPEVVVSPCGVFDVVVYVDVVDSTTGLDDKVIPKVHGCVPCIVG